MSTSTTSTDSVTKDFPSTGQIFSEAWELLKNKISTLIVFMLANIGAAAVGFLLLLLTVGASLLPLIKEGAFENPESAVAIFSALMGSLGIFIVVGIVISIVGYAIRVGLILRIADAKNELTNMAAIKKGFSLIVPAIVPTLLSILLIAGGFAFFLIPGVIFAFLFQYVLFEIVLKGKTGTEALLASQRTVKQFVGPILLNGLIYIGMYILITMVVPNIITNMDASAGSAYSVIGMFINAVLGWYGVTLSYVIFKHADALTDTNKQVSLTGPIVFGLLGWGILILIFSTAFSTFGKNKDAFMQQMKGSVQEELMKDYQNESGANGTMYNDVNVNVDTEVNITTVPVQ